MQAPARPLTSWPSHLSEEPQHRIPHTVRKRLIAVRARRKRSRILSKDRALIRSPRTSGFIHARRSRAPMHTLRLSASIHILRVRAPVCSWRTNASASWFCVVARAMRTGSESRPHDESSAIVRAARVVSCALTPLRLPFARLHTKRERIAPFRAGRLSGCLYQTLGRQGVNAWMVGNSWPDFGGACAGEGYAPTHLTARLREASMALTLSHQSALDVYRVLRAEGCNPHEMDATSLAVPAPWAGKRFTAKDFDPSVWRWPTPNRERPLHILVPARDCRRYIAGCCAHTSIRDLPPRSILWLDEHASIVSPELLFLQMADVFSFPALVMLGYELCGHFARSPSEPRDGVISDDMAAATDTASIKSYLSKVGAKRGVIVARRALQYVHDHALSSPEAILALMYSLPPEEGGYGMGPVTLNMRVDVDDCDNWTGAKTRLPDLMFSFAPVGINYDGSKHLDLGELVRLARQAALSGADERDEANSLLGSKMAEVREKVLEDA